MSDESTRDGGAGASAPTGARVAAALEAVAMRALVADRIEPTALEPLLRSIVEATVALFEAETSSIALYDPATDRLVFRVAVGPAADGVIGLSVRSDEGIAGYVFTTSQALAIGDVRADPRFSQTTAEMTGFLPRSILAVPLADEISTLGVLEILDPQRGGTFGLHDLELAGIFARQASVAIRALRVERDIGTLLQGTLVALAAPEADPDAEVGADAAPEGGADPTVLATAVDRAIADARAGLGDDDALWALADAVARARGAGPEQVALVLDILESLTRHAERRTSRGRSR